MYDDKITYLFSIELIKYGIIKDVNIKNALVCKNWYKHLKSDLIMKKAKYYSVQVYNTILDKLYYDLNDLFNVNTFMFYYYDSLLYKIMSMIVKDNSINLLVKNDMIYIYNMHINKKNKHLVDNDISNEYKYNLKLWFDYDVKYS